MQAIENFFLWLAYDFHTTRYMWHTKFQAIWWSTADLLLILAFLKIVDRLKAKTGEKPIRHRYWLLFASATLKAVPFFFHTPDMFISLDFLICGLQYGLLVYTIIVDWKIIMALPGFFRPPV